MSKEKNVVFVTSEAVPFIKTGGLADVCGALPEALANHGIAVKVFLPNYKLGKQNDFRLKKFNRFCSFTTLDNGIEYYFIDHPFYFDRDGIYGDAKGDYPDNLRRYHYFCTRTLDVISQFKKKIDIIHCHDWQTALIPALLKVEGTSSLEGNIKTLLTIHNLAFQGLFPQQQFDQLGIPQDYFHPEHFEYYGKINLLKAGIVFADKISTVSPTYAKEILSPEYGCGLESVLLTRKDGIEGILNGIDTNIWDPKQDELINQVYTKDNWQTAKAINKEALLTSMRLDKDLDVPVFGFVGRLADQKGIDQIIQVMDKLISMNARIVIQGQGDKKLESQLKAIAKKYKGKMAVSFEFNESTAHLIYAASDFFLMPSRFEPCGLSQMISLVYGTLPIVFRTGGLADTITNYDVHNGLGNGFVYEDYNPSSFMDACKQAIKLFVDNHAHQKLVTRALESDFSWSKSAHNYARLYSCLLSE